ncbi:acyloxyacyl hydrolase [Prosthecochloris sp.]|jgi:hypothetical protein|uniref:acyloxyacyl hydrolase n=1 Tax=Prosthecochloris sp. TaxID=290513 RepID=UPI0025DE0C1C|nr:acyloxyacyl hydrolase [Prosthecochloris sp.]
MHIRKVVVALIVTCFSLSPLVASADSSTRVHAFTDRVEPFRFSELSFSSGYARGELRRDDDLEVIPFSVRVGFDISDFVGLSGPGALQLGIEPFVNTIVAPEDGVEIGLNVGFRYITPLTDEISFYGEIGSGPAYFSIDTVEQGDDGFNFLSQIGAGFQFELAHNLAFNAGYRFRHLSNAGFSDPNDGINTNAFITGISISY